MPSEIIQLTVGGILLGGIYGLAAMGLSVSFGVLRILNLAHGEFLMVGSLITYALFVSLGVNPFLGALLLIPIFILLGAGFYWVLLKPIARKPARDMLTASVLVTLGIALAVEDLTAFLWERPVTGIAYSLPPLEIGGVVVSSVRVLILIFICCMAAAFHVFLRTTFAGKAVRAITQCRDGAEIVGVDIARIAAWTFGLGAAAAGAAGAFYVTLFTVTPAMGIPLTVKYMCVVVLGGLGSLIGSVLGGLILGLSEAAAAYWIGPEWSPCVAFLLLIVILIAKPEGFFGSR
ncbi:MAG: branched-chain amino acid ABC transporter permease [Desulfomonilaceae bacterium]|nr:branched-chain amino acid ABC transporter permease [Desulfomonilaceae bacterium]